MVCFILFQFFNGFFLAFSSVSMFFVVVFERFVSCTSWFLRVFLVENSLKRFGASKVDIASGEMHFEEGQRCFWCPWFLLVFFFWCFFWEGVFLRCPSFWCPSFFEEGVFLVSLVSLVLLRCLKVFVFWFCREVFFFEGVFGPYPRDPNTKN